MPQRKEIFQITLYLVVLYGTWSLCRFLILPFIEHFFSSTAMRGSIEQIVETIVFVPLTVFFIRPKNFFSVWIYLKLNVLGKGFFWCLLAMIAWLEIAIVTVVNSHHRINVPSLLSADTILTVLFVGLTEEIPFRGFLLQKLQPLCGWWGAIFLSALLFAGIHLPLWVQYPPPMPLPIAFAGITFTGIIYGLIFWRTRSLWSVILIHSCYDLSVFLVTSALR